MAIPDLTMAFVGDVMLGRLLNQHLKHVPAGFAWGDTLPVLRQADVKLCNLECVVTDRGEPWSVTPKVFHFRTDAKNVAVLKAAGVNMVSLANNHVLDYGYDGLQNMLEVLDGAGIAGAGAGINIDAAATPAMLEVKGRRVAMLAFTDNRPDWRAHLQTPGVLHVPTDPRDRRAQALFLTVSQLKAKSDIVVVSAHWGGNWGYDVPPEHIAFARRLVLAGADVVYGHSPHVCRAVEMFLGRPILYSCGDFLTDYAVDPTEPNDESFVFLVDFSGQEVVGVRLCPTIIENFQVRLAGPRGPNIAGRMRQLLGQFETLNVWKAEAAQLEISGAP